MAKSIKEIGKKTEELIEQGKEADRNIQSCQTRVSNANSRVKEAMQDLARASETDEDGNPKGDVKAAMAQVNMAKQQLAASQRALTAAALEAGRVEQRKIGHVKEIQQHNKTAKYNLEQLQKLKSMAFGSESKYLTEGIVDRLNEAEDSRVALLKSMGIDETPEYVSDGDSGSTFSSWSGGGFSALDIGGSARHYEGGNGATEANANGKGIAAPLGGGLGALVSSLFGGGPNDSSSRKADGGIYTQYTNRDQLSRNDDHYIDDFHNNFYVYNGLIRHGESSKDVEQVRKIINNHRIPEDTVFYRKATINDLGMEFFNLSIEEMAGKCYRFDGIMTVSSMDKKYSMGGSNIEFEIKAPKGTPGLDLTKVDYYLEAMFDSPYCYIESARPEGHNTTHLVVRILSEDEYKLLNNGLSAITNHESLKQYMELKHGIQLDDSISKLNIDTVKDAISGIENVISDYPDVGTYLQTGITSSAGVMSCSGSKLSFNPEYFNDNTKLRDTCANMSSRGFWVANSSPVSIGVHEAAHGIEWSLIQANHEYTDDYQKVTAWNNCSEASKIVWQACDNLKKSSYGEGKSSTELIRSISTYAMENDSETMAEAFADVFANGDNAKPLSNEIKRLTKILMNNYKGGK